MGFSKAQVMGWIAASKGEPAPKESKYHVSSKETRTCDGITFDSKTEMHYYRKLKGMQDQGTIRYFLRQVAFRLPGNTKYVADFVVFYPDKPEQVIDVKGMRTAAYIKNKKQVEDLYPIKIVEISR